VHQGMACLLVLSSPSGGWLATATFAYHHHCHSSHFGYGMFAMQFSTHHELCHSEVATRPRLQPPICMAAISEGSVPEATALTVHAAMLCTCTAQCHCLHHARHPTKEAASSSLQASRITLWISSSVCLNWSCICSLGGSSCTQHVAYCYY
jgi:hypothetical protein